jgi:hypothetical protein
MEYFRMLINVVSFGLRRHQCQVVKWYEQDGRDSSHIVYELPLLALHERLQASAIDGVVGLGMKQLD